MSRLFLLMAIAVVVYLLIKSYRRNVPPQQDNPAAEDMVRCAHCGVHLPKSESILAGGNFFCCAEHRNAFRK
jgi:uncharacterized protein